LENVVPIRRRHQRSGWIHRTETARHQNLTELSRRNLALEEQLAQLRREHDGLRHTLYEAAQVQRRLCGPRYLRRRAFEIASEIFPVRHLSGDFISVFEHGDDLVFAIGDIAGKGLPAAIWFTHLVGMIQQQFGASGDPAATLSAINRVLLRTRLESPLTSLLLAKLELETGEITYCNAGHPPSLLLRADGQVESLREGGPLLGVVAGAGFDNGKATLQPGDTLLGYSDGIVECRNPEGFDFGVDRLLAAAQTDGGSTATVFSVLGAVEDYAGSHPREDDMAVIVVHRVGN
jgi:sigma-B regulation protein RsbU (phosphoserine phosphatase)